MIFAMIVYTASLIGIEEAGFKRSLVQRVDSGLRSSLIIYSAINIAFISRVNVNLMFIVKIPFSNGAKVNEVR